MDFLHINLGNLLTIASFIVGGVYFIATIRGMVSTQGTKIEFQSQRLISVESELKKLADVIVKLAVQEERLVAMDQRMLMQGQRIDEIMRQVGALRDRA